MFAEERKEEIVKILKNKNSITVEELTNKFSVSKATIRNDLNELENKDFLKRTHGGAISNHFLENVSNHNERKSLNKHEKDKIGKKAIELISNDDVIFLDSGTTTYQVAKYIKGFVNLTIITNDIHIINLLVTSEGVNIIAIGGRVNKQNLSIVSRNSEFFINNYNVSKIFLGVSGFTLNEGITAPNEKIAGIKKKMIESSQKVIAICDSSKFGKAAFAKVCDLKEIDTLLTDKGIPKEYSDFLKEKGIQVIITD